jgi:tRNA(Ile)-lysidine synthase
MTSIAHAVETFFTRHGVAGKRVALGLSGGVDSMVLLDVMAALNLSKSAWIKEFQAIHVNHGISANAPAWARFCAEECAKRSVAIKLVEVTVARDSGQGLEAAAREARYAALASADVDVILTAHHQDDQAETVLHQLFRGTGLNGVAGMGEARMLSQRHTLLRPFLKVSRAQIETYAREHGLSWVEDESNVDTDFTRNFLRHELSPLIQSRFPHYAESLSRFSNHAAESAVLNEALAQIDLRWDGTTAHADLLDALPRTRQVNALYHWLRWQRVKPPSRLQLEAWAEQVFRPAPTDKPHRAGGHDTVIRRRGDKLFLE